MAFATENSIRKDKAQVSDYKLWSSSRGIKLSETIKKGLE
jgi:ABC-type Fe3+-citrate transport system substrate-binding protein